MGNLITVYRRECSSYFNSPIAYIFIVVFLWAMAFFFFPFLSFFQSPDPSFRVYFEHPIPFAFFSLVFIPALAMRLWSEERKQGTIELLLTFPLKTWQVVLAKFLAGYTVVAVAILLTLTVPLSIAPVLELDWGAVFSSYVGILLLAAVYIALGAFASALTENQIVAFMITVLVTAPLCFIGFPAVVRWFNENLFGLGSFLGDFGTYVHFQNFAKGLLNPVDIVYAVSMTILFLILNNIVVESRKY